MYEKNIAAQNLGYKNKHPLHPGAKHGNPTRGTDPVSNGLPGVEVSCENCHSATPHIQNTTPPVMQASLWK